LNVEASLIQGDRGEFTVWVDQRKVAGKSGDDYPSDAEIVASVRAAMQETYRR